MSAVGWLWARRWGAWRARHIGRCIAHDLVLVVRWEGVCINMQRLGLDCSVGRPMAMWERSRRPSFMRVANCVGGKGRSRREDMRTSVVRDRSSKLVSRATHRLSISLHTTSHCSIAVCLVSDADEIVRQLFHHRRCCPWLRAFRVMCYEHGLGRLHNHHTLLALCRSVSQVKGWTWAWPSYLLAVE